MKLHIYNTKKGLVCVRLSQFNSLFIVTIQYIIPTFQMKLYRTVTAACYDHPKLINIYLLTTKKD